MQTIRFISKRRTINIQETDEYLRDLDERYEDDEYICEHCGGRLKKGYEEYEFLGSIERKVIWYCPDCE